MNVAVPDTAREASGRRATFLLFTAFAIERSCPDFLKTIVTPPKTIP